MTGFDLHQSSSYSLRRSSAPFSHVPLARAQNAITMPQEKVETDKPLPQGAVEAQRRLVNELANAKLFAQRAHFEPPAALALDRATTLLSLLAIHCNEDAANAEVSFDGDGMIEVTATRGFRRYTVEITPDGATVQMIAQHAETGAVLGPSVTVSTEQDAVSRIERSA